MTLNVSGDLLWHNTLWMSAELDGEGKMDFTPQLASLKPFIERADIAICHAEVPFAKPGGPYSQYPRFAAPQEIATTVKALGWDICTTASNHTMDQGWDGLVRTVEVHENAGIRTVGSYRTKEEAQTPVIVATESGVKVGFVSQTYGLNGLSKAEGKPWSIDILDADKAIADAKRVRAAGADIVVVHIHAGTEYQHQPNSEQQAFVDKVTRSPDIDLVFGQHAHVTQPISKVNGKWVIYGTGNLIAQSTRKYEGTYDGYMAEVQFTAKNGRYQATRVIWAPTVITRYSSGTPARVYLIPDALAKGIGPAETLRASAKKTRRIVAPEPLEGIVELIGPA